MFYVWNGCGCVGAFKKDLHGLPSSDVVVARVYEQNIYAILVDCKGQERDGCTLEFKEYLKILILCMVFVSFCCCTMFYGYVVRSRRA